MPAMDEAERRSYLGRVLELDPRRDAAAIVRERARALGLRTALDAAVEPEEAEPSAGLAEWPKPPPRRRREPKAVSSRRRRSNGGIVRWLFAGWITLVIFRAIWRAVTS